MRATPNGHTYSAADEHEEKLGEPLLRATLSNGAEMLSYIAPPIWRDYIRSYMVESTPGKAKIQNHTPIPQ